MVVVGGGRESDYSVCPHPLLQFLQFMSVWLRQVTSGYVSLRWRDGTWSSTIDCLIHYLIHNHFSEGTFSLLSKIELLDFSHNSIMKIDDNTLAGMDVKKLDLSHNNLRKVPTLSLQKLTKVSKLLLDDNLYRTLESHAIYRIKGRASN